MRGRGIAFIFISYFYQSKTEVFDCCNVDYTPLRTFGSL